MQNNYQALVVPRLIDMLDQCKNIRIHHGCGINRIHHWCSVGTEKSQPEGPPFQWETRLAEFPTERWTRGLGFFWNHWTPMIDSFSHIPRPYGTVLCNICWWRQWGRCKQSMTRAIQINLKQRINSALNVNKRLFHQNGFTRTSLSVTVTRVSNFVEENVCVCVFVVFFFIVKAPLPGAFSHALSNRLNMSIAMHSTCSKHWIKVLSKNAQFYLKADLNRWKINIELFLNNSTFVFEGIQSCAKNVISH